VGKTETGLALAEALYGGEENIITINMSEYQEAHTVSTLKGSPPGYVVMVKAEFSLRRFGADPTVSFYWMK